MVLAAAGHLRSSRDRGQASLDWLAVSLLVAVLAAAGGGVAWSAGVGEAVVLQLHRALCLVRAGDCERDRVPCVVASRREIARWSVRFGVLRLGAGWVGLVEERSDGTAVVSRIREDTLGLDASVGFAGAIALSGAEALSLGGELRAQALARAGDGLTWMVPSRADAMRLLDRLGDDRLLSLSGSALARALLDDGLHLPEPDELFGERTGDTELRLLLGLPRITLAARGGAIATLGSRRIRATGHRVEYFRLTAEAAAGLGLAGGVAQGLVTLGIETDASGRPLDLAVLRAGRFGVTADLPVDLRTTAGYIGTLGRRRLYEAEHHLDLTIPANLAAVRRLLSHPGPASLADVGRRLSGTAIAHTRTYAVSDRRDAVAATGGVVGGFGAELSREVIRTRLLDAATRGFDGRWSRRGDCGE